MHLQKNDGSDIDLVKEALQGDVEAYTELYTGYFDCVQATCRKILKNEHWIEDVAHDTFIQAFIKLRNFLTKEGPDSFKAWLIVIAKHLAINEWLRQERSKRLQENIRVSAVSPDDPTIAEAEEKELTRQVWNALGKLDRVTEICIVAHDIYEIPTKDIARGLGLKDNKVKHLLKKGHERLKILLGPFHRGIQ